MTDGQRRTLAQFLVRPGMFVQSLEKVTIVAFIDGFEAGAEKVLITDQLSEWLSEKYKIQPSNRGWPGQVQQYADKKSIDWFEGFKELILEIMP